MEKPPRQLLWGPFCYKPPFTISYQAYKAHKHWNPEQLRKKERQLGAGEGQRREGDGKKLKGATQRNLEPLILQLMRPLMHYKI